MTVRYLLVFSLFFSQIIIADEWVFSKKTPVSPHTGKTIFHHVESSGRKNIAVNNKSVVIVWEDNHNGSPQVYAAFKNLEKKQFSRPILISTGKVAYEPSVASLGNSFIVAFEQDNIIWTRSINETSLGQMTRLSQGKASQVSIAVMGKRIVATWSERGNKFRRIMIAQLLKTGGHLQIEKRKQVDSDPPAADQLYPAVAMSINGTIIVWEDRRFGHTALFSCYTKDGKIFSPPATINNIIRKSKQYGSGNGVTRVALTAVGKGQIAATWMDKRAFLTGYDIYASISKNGGKTFLENTQVQDDFGNDIAQWHPAITGSPNGRVIIAWDDNRDETSDIWLSWREGMHWSDDVLVTPASGPGIQTDPSIALDAQEKLHIVWINKEENRPSQLFYTSAIFQNN